MPCAGETVSEKHNGLRNSQSVGVALIRVMLWVLGQRRVWGWGWGEGRGGRLSKNCRILLSKGCFTTVK